MIRKTYNNNIEEYNLEDDRPIECLYLKINFSNQKNKILCLYVDLYCLI